MALEIVQGSEAPNDAWRNNESHYRAEEKREILFLSHEVNGTTMQPGEDPFKIMMEIDQLAADLHRLGDIFVTQLRKCVINLAGLSADYDVEIYMLENNPTNRERTEVKPVVGNRYNRLLRKQQDTTALLASKGTTTVDHGEKNRSPRNQFEGNYFNCGRKGHRAQDYSSAKKIEKSEDAAADKKGGGRGKYHVCGSEEHFAYKHRGLCRSLDERGAEKER